MIHKHHNGHFGINGIDIHPASDTDVDLITVDVTGVPKLSWDESASSFRINAGYIIRPITDSVTAVQVLDADQGIPVLNVDTVNERVGIGEAAPTATLHIVNVEDNANVTVFNLEGKRPTPANNDTMYIYYRMYNDAPASFEYARTTITADDITTDEEEGSLLFEVARAGTLETVLKMSATTVVVNEPGADRDFRIEAVGQANALVVQGSDGNIGIGNATPASKLMVDGSSDEIQCIVQAHSSQTANIVEIQNSAAQTNFMIDDQFTMAFRETTTPTADTNFGKIWTTTSNELWFQDGAGANHLLHGDAYSNIWFHSSTAAVVTISTEDAFTLIDSFAVVGNEDDASGVVGNTSTNTFTLSANAGGEYELSYHASITATGASKEILMCIGITLATPKDITDVTDDTVSPIVITSTDHGFDNGDMVEIAGVLGNTAANGSFIVAGKTANTFQIVALDGTATTGNGDFDEGTPTGDITIWYPGNMVSHRVVSQTDLGSVSATGIHEISNSDALSLYIANLDDTNNINVYAVSLDIYRIGD
jgi:hypothetical protein